MTTATDRTEASKRAVAEAMHLVIRTFESNGVGINTGALAMICVLAEAEANGVLAPRLTLAVRAMLRVVRQMERELRSDRGE